MGGLVRWKIFRRSLEHEPFSSNACGMLEHPSTTGAFARVRQLHTKRLHAPLFALVD